MENRRIAGSRLKGPARLHKISPLVAWTVFHSDDPVNYDRYWVCDLCAHFSFYFKIFLFVLLQKWHIFAENYFKRREIWYENFITVSAETTSDCHKMGCCVSVSLEMVSWSSRCSPLSSALISVSVVLSGWESLTLPGRDTNPSQVSFPADAGTHLFTREGWKAELA